MLTVKSIKFPRRTRTAVAAASTGGPSLGTWLERVRAIGDPHVTEAIEGIWCGRSGEARIEMPGTASFLCVGWHEGRVEWSYLS